MLDKAFCMVYNGSIKEAKMETKIYAKFMLGLPLTEQEYAYYVLYLAR